MAEHDERSDHQAHRGGELNDQQGLTQHPSPTLAIGKITLKGRHRLEARDKEGRIKTRQQTREQENGHKTEPQPRVFQDVIEYKMFVRQVIECREEGRKQDDAGRYYCDQLIAKTAEPGIDVFRLNGYYEEIIKYMIAVKNMPAALKYLTSNKELLEKINDKIGLSRNYNLWFSLDTTQGKYKAAVADILKEKLVDDTILNAEKTNAVRKLEIQYESGKKRTTSD